MEGEPATVAAEEKRFSFGSAILWVGILVLLYVLSIGPVVMLNNKGLFRSRAVDRFLEAFYAPLIWTYEHSIMRQPLRAYVDWWMKF